MIAAFLVMSVADVNNTVLPILVLAAHAASNRFNPCKAQYPELDIVAALALVSFGWLVLGRVTATGNLAFYGMTAMGMCLSLVAVATVQVRPLRHWAVQALGALILICLYDWLMRFNGPLALPATDMWWRLGGTVVLSMMLPSAMPHIFASGRAAKVTILAVPVPIIGFLMLVGQDWGVAS